MNSAVTAPAASRDAFRRALRALTLGSAIGLMSVPAFAADDAPVAPEVYKSAKDKNSYATGVMTARNLMRNEVPFDLDVLIQGLRDGVTGGDLRMSEKEIKIVLSAMQADIQRKLSNERQVKIGLNRERGNLYREEFRKKEGTVVLPGDLMYRVIKAGNGDKPTETGTVVVRYRGTNIDGKEFDATPEGKTVTIKLTDVITGWREALKRMNAGSTWEVVVPPSMAYGNRGLSASGIDPNETLVFNIELVAIVR